MSTFCADCTHLLKERKSDPPWRWMCVKHKRLEGFGFVTKEFWDDMPPFLYAKDVNGGDCPLFEADQGRQMKLGMENRGEGTKAASDDRTNCKAEHPRA